MSNKRITIELFGIAKELEFRIAPNGTGYQSVDYCVLVRNLTGKTVSRQQLRLNSKHQVCSPVFNNRPALHVGWTDQYVTESPTQGKNLRITSTLSYKQVKASADQKMRDSADRAAGIDRKKLSMDAAVAALERAPKASPATVQSFQAYPDGSGAEAVISYKGYVFACNHLGKPSMTLIRPQSGTRVEHKIALEVCRKAYAELLAKHCDAAWMALNSAMYASEAK